MIPKNHFLPEKGNNQDSPDTLCDSLMAEMPGELTFGINQSQVSSIDTVTDQQVIDSMSLAFHEFGIIVEQVEQHHWLLYFQRLNKKQLIQMKILLRF